MPHVRNFIKKGTLALFSCEFCENFQNTFFTEHLRETASVINTEINFFWALPKKIMGEYLPTLS